MKLKTEEKHEDILKKKVFHILNTEKEVSKALNEKYLELYRFNNLQRYFNALVDYIVVKKGHANIAKGFLAVSTERLLYKAFYALKKRAKDNLIQRRSKKLAEVFYTHKLYTKGFEALCWLRKLRKKASILLNRKTKKTLIKYYRIWRVASREERRFHKVKQYKEGNQLHKIFFAWKKFSAREKVVHGIVREFTERRNYVYIRIAFALWKKLVSVTNQKSSVGQALFISYVHNFKKQVFHAWKSTSGMLRHLNILASRVSAHHEGNLRKKYLKIWLKRTAKFRYEVISGLELASRKDINRFEKLFMTWAAITKEKIIRRRLLSLCIEKVKNSLIFKSFRAWNIYVAGKRTRKEIVFIRKQFSEIQTLKRIFAVLRLWADSKLRERSVIQRILYMEKTRLLSSCFDIWCEAYKDIAFEKVGTVITDK